MKENALNIYVLFWDIGNGDKHMKLYTIGYAGKKIEEFIDILKQNKITSIVDVRTMPLSKTFPEYNSNSIKDILRKNGIYYLVFSNEFGARREEQNTYISLTDFDGKNIKVVDFKKVYELPIFIDGVNRVEDGLKKELKIAFMCSEKNPFDCHRANMIAEYFYQKGFEIKHIIDQQNIIDHKKFDIFYEDNFFKKKLYFMKKNSEILNYKYNLFGHGNDEFPEYIVYWLNFFKYYDRNKGWILRNIEIGYKEGTIEND